MPWWQWVLLGFGAIGWIAFILLCIGLSWMNPNNMWK